MGYNVIPQYACTMCKDLILAISMLITSNIFHFSVFRRFKIFFSYYQKVLK